MRRGSFSGGGSRLCPGRAYFFAGELLARTALSEAPFSPAPLSAFFETLAGSCSRASVPAKLGSCLRLPGRSGILAEAGTERFFLLFRIGFLGGVPDSVRVEFFKTSSSGLSSSKSEKVSLSMAETILRRVRPYARCSRARAGPRTLTPARAAGHAAKAFDEYPERSLKRTTRHKS